MGLSKNRIAIFFFIMATLCSSMAEEYEVEWGTNVKKWSSKKKLEVGDTLVFKYDSGSDNVLQVNKDDYKSCKASSPIASYDGGNDSVALSAEGEYYFISGNPENCKDGEKLKIKVKASKDNKDKKGGDRSPSTTGGDRGASTSLTSNCFTTAMLGLTILVLVTFL